ncbi:Germin-like protein subfamily 1 member 20 [Morella rubra]|uniref:Germin-like protein subfamily 1 member 20 n=1 Tax=Morella rubra TaxID=262757 RepID=A0A6A1USC7_9ROSI|nr:Germin-like protein subfamily 1 member 20 [Morella rubra]
MRSVTKYPVTVLLFAFACSMASASDPSPLQDFCVAINSSTSAVFVNGKFCKNPKVVTADDFFFSGLQIPRNTANQLGSNVTRVNVDLLPGLNTLGISLARIDFAPYGVNPPHFHPRGTEITMVAEGTLYVGFVTSDTDTVSSPKF